MSRLTEIIDLIPAVLLERIAELESVTTAWIVELKRVLK